MIDYSAISGTFFEMVDDMLIDGRWHFGDLLDADGREVERWTHGPGSRTKSAAGTSQARSVGVVGRVPMELGFNTFKTLIASERAAELLRQFAPEGIALFPVAAVGKPYQIVDIIDQVECLDEGLSHVERFVPNDTVRPDRAGEVSLVIDLHIHADRAAGRHLFRVADWDVAVIVSAALRAAIGAAGLTGVVFRNVTHPGIADYRVKHAQRRRQN